MRLLEGSVVAGFRLERHLGSGAAGDVYLAKLESPWGDLSPGARVAFKHYKDWLFEEGEGKQSERIRREAALAGVAHENLVQIYGTGSANFDGSTVHYLIMEYLEGETLTKFIARSAPLDARSIKTLIQQLCQAVKALHKRDKIHRDIKPDNIMVVADPPTRLKLMDFGVLKDLTGQGVTESHEFLGTVRYAAPEWILSRVELTLKGQVLLDLYSIGAVLADLINGFPLFPEVRSRYQLAELKSRYEPQIVRQDIPVAFISLARGLIEVQPSVRHPSTVAELLKALDALDPAQPQTLEESLERSLQGFDQIRQQYLSNQLEIQSLQEKRVALDRTILKVFRHLYDFTGKRFPVEEWNESEAAASFGLAVDEKRLFFFPLTISCDWHIAQAFDISIRLAGFYSWERYQRRDFKDDLAEIVKSKWRILLAQLSNTDVAYEGACIEPAIEEAVKKALLGILNGYLQVNAADAKARQLGLILTYSLIKIDSRGWVMGQDTRYSWPEPPLKTCFVMNCDTPIVSSGAFLCERHQRELASAGR